MHLKVIFGQLFVIFNYLMNFIYLTQGEFKTRFLTFKNYSIENDY